MPRKIFTTATDKDFGDNWTIASLGAEPDGTNHYVTTHYVHASELYRFSAGAKDDAKLIARLLNWYYNAIDADKILDAMDEALEADDA